MIHAVRDVQHLIGFVPCQAVGEHKLTRAAPVGAPDIKLMFAIRREVNYPGITVAVRDEECAVGCHDRDICRFTEVRGVVSRLEGHPEREHYGGAPRGHQLVLWRQELKARAIRRSYAHQAGGDFQARISALDASRSR